jgi:tRNA (guanine37-N1)-methyltransferase
MTYVNFHILTLFPEIFPGFLNYSLAGRAKENDIWSLSTIDIRAFAHDRHKTVDDTPYGGGAGLVLKPDVLEKAYLSINSPGKNIYLSPRGKPLTQNLIESLIPNENITLLCGRYEGVDQRFIDTYDFEEISIGDYILSGGEQAALILIDSLVRLLPGVMGNNSTSDEESFKNGLLEYPHYTKPDMWTDTTGKVHQVPEILKSGDHKKILDLI